MSASVIVGYSCRNLSRRAGRVVAVYRSRDSVNHTSIGEVASTAGSLSRPTIGCHSGSVSSRDTPQHLEEVIASGQETPTVIHSPHREEERKETLVAELTQLQALTTTLSLDETRITTLLRDALGNLPTLLGRQVSLARQMLRVLLDGHIFCEPIEGDHTPGYRFTATGTFGRLLTGTSVVNAGGGGEGS